ncbi:hypothetical protein [Legionella tunisiensis]|uniref:hypothetical protein n=1 Tax=Legionella tunisiensis TaxID=1034944 RepID=UPI00035E12A3|nr:hypothetical protein [Legionella tunisiensis]
MTKEELCSAIFNANAWGFTHSKMHKYFIPDDIKHTEEEKKPFIITVLGQSLIKERRNSLKNSRALSKKKSNICTSIYKRK